MIFPHQIWKLQPQMYELFNLTVEWRIGIGPPILAYDRNIDSLKLKLFNICFDFPSICYKFFVIFDENNVVDIF